jgi:hypothetical protein
VNDASDAYAAASARAVFMAVGGVQMIRTPLVSSNTGGRRRHLAQCDQLGLLVTVCALEDAEPGLTSARVVTPFRVVWALLGRLVYAIRAGMFSGASDTGDSTSRGYWGFVAQVVRRVSRASSRQTTLVAALGELETSLQIAIFGPVSKDRYPSLGGSRVRIPPPADDLLLVTDGAAAEVPAHHNAFPAP